MSDPLLDGLAKNTRRGGLEERARDLLSLHPHVRWRARQPRRPSHEQFIGHAIHWSRIVTRKSRNEPESAIYPQALTTQK